MVAVPYFITTSAALAGAVGPRQASEAPSARAGAVAGGRVRIMVSPPSGYSGIIGPRLAASVGAPDYSWLRNPAKPPFGAGRRDRSAGTDGRNFCEFAHLARNHAFPSAFGVIAQKGVPAVRGDSEA